MVVLADPDFYTNREDAPDVIREHGELKSQIEQLEEEWLEITDKIEQTPRRINEKV